jgi:hypothetical protein
LAPTGVFRLPQTAILHGFAVQGCFRNPEITVTSASNVQVIFTPMQAAAQGAWRQAE